MKWLTWFTKRNGTMLPTSGDASILDRGAFERALQQQRASCDRRGGNFVLMVIGVESAGSTKPQRKTIEKLAAVISKRVRLSDTAGMYDEKGERIGVILADTGRAGAEEFMRSVETLMRGSMNGSWTPDFRLSCGLFAYPDTIAAVMVANTEPAKDAAPAQMIG